MSVERSPDTDERPEGRGWLRIGAIGSTPVYLHWSAPVVAWFPVFLIGAFSPVKGWLFIVYALLLTMSLVLLHELAHLAVARLTGVGVRRMELAGSGGACVLDGLSAGINPRGWTAADILKLKIWRLVCVVAAGLIVQAIVLGVTVAVLMRYGTPKSALAISAAVIFTAVNGYMILANLVPRKGSDGQLLLGLLMLALARHLRPDIVQELRPSGNGSDAVVPKDARIDSGTRERAR